MGDGAFDGEPIAQVVLAKQPDAQIILPPHKTAVCSSTGDTAGSEFAKAYEHLHIGPAIEVQVAARAVTAALIVGVGAAGGRQI